MATDVVAALILLRSEQHTLPDTLLRESLASMEPNLFNSDHPDSRVSIV